MASLFLGQQDDIQSPEPINGRDYLIKLHKYLQVNASRLSPSRPSNTSTIGPSILQQSYTLLTLGLDPNSAPLSRSLKVPLTLGFGQPSSNPSLRTNPPKYIKPLLLRLPPDRLLYLLLRWQTLPQSLNHVGRTDVPIEEGIPVSARGARLSDAKIMKGSVEGDVRSVRSWVGSMRSVSMGSLVSREGGKGWWGRKEEINEDQILLQLYSMFTLLPALLIHPPFVSEPPILELIEAGGYTQLGGIDVRVPLDILRNLQILELEEYDPRALLIPPNPGMRSLTVKDVQDGDDWIEELLTIPADEEQSGSQNQSQDIETDSKKSENRPLKARFPNLHHLSLISTTLLNFPSLPELNSLTHLDLSNNLLNTLPSSLSGLTSLTSLNLSNNVIVSLRTSWEIIPKVKSLNLSGNRIDNLIGLDKCLNLERIDLRRNELNDFEEIGRLSVLPKIKEIYCSKNYFNDTIANVNENKEIEYRVELGILFKEENPNSQITFDNTPFTWSESRKIDLALEKKGKLNQIHSPNPSIQQHQNSTHTRYSSEPTSSIPKSPNPNLNANTNTDTDINHSASRFNSVNSIDQNRLSTQPTPKTTTTTSVKSPSSTASAIAKKKSKRRVINLDSPNDITDDGISNTKKTIEDSLRGSLRVPGKVIEEQSEEEEEQSSAANDDGFQRKVGNHNNGDEDIEQIDENSRDILGPNHQQEQQQQQQQLQEPPSIKVVSSKRKNNRKGLKKDTFDPIP
ncbi:uncharacterized protein L201_003944 [Kwoniella dendrophila CBS 6074]|uniref:Leucine-rich repeat-containing protein n=1 Tax=Kwoniella dendrophila CBS 6074 TaxID=1295534 RepID=A0AAX4JUB3_9TREE